MDAQHPEGNRWPLVIIRRFRDLQPALFALGILESAGITSTISDENIVRMDWRWSNAIGGVKLLVREEDAAEATKLLQLPIPEPSIFLTLANGNSRVVRVAVPWK